MRTTIHHLIGTSVAAIAAGAVPNAAHAQQTYSFDLPAQRLGDALRAIGGRANASVAFDPAIVRGKSAPAVKGAMSVREALDRALAGSGLQVRAADNGGYVVAAPAHQADEGPASPPADAMGDTAVANADIVVTGSRIQGAPVAAPVITLMQRQIQDSGLANMGDVIRAIPQNFGGSLNPGTGFNVPNRNGSNTGSGSSIDLRGLGGDATLTLLNGHRLASSGSRQAIDVSSIPLVALDRIEIVADGASALYGSDAVAGVANIILKRDYDGLYTQARVGGSLQGGDQQQQYDVVAGKTWATGGFMAAYDFSYASPILARQRAYTRAVNPGLTLWPLLRQHSATFTAHQALVGNLELDIDALYNSRYANQSYALSALGNPLVFGATQITHDYSFSIAPELKLRLGGGWHASLQAVYSQDKAEAYRAYNGLATPPALICYCNKLQNYEAEAGGSLFELPAGAVKIAIGGGYRKTDYHGYYLYGATQNIQVSQDDYYAFGELSLPLIAPGQGMPFAYQLDISAAVRYEDYPGIKHTASPKLGVIYAPSADLELKASWGTSFRAPTFFELYSTQSAIVYSIAGVGGSGYPAGATALVLGGGNPVLNPERATTWTVSAELHPRAVPGLRFGLSYFHIDYRDRIVSPIAYTSASLSDPNYSYYVQYSPSTAAINAAIAGRTFASLVAGPFDPSKVVAIIDGSNVNAASQAIHGIDLSAEYKIALGGTGSLRLSAEGTYLHSEQRLSAQQPTTPLAGTIFNPPHVRGRGGATWESGGFGLAAFLNYSGGFDDTRKLPNDRIGSIATVDMTARYAIGETAGPLRNVSIAVSVLNILGRTPRRIASATVYEQPYDSLNDTPVGRFASVTVSKKW